MSLNKIAILLAVLSLSIAVFFNELNLHHLRKDGIALKNNETVQTNDDYSYLHPIDNLINTGSFYSNDLEKYTSVIRSPGYGLSYYIIAKITGVSTALFYHKIMQLLLYALSIYCFVFIAFALLKSKIWTIVVTFIYACLPLSIGFLYYTLTEAITPALVIFYVFFLLRAEAESRNKLKLFNYFLAALVLSYLFLTRPFLGIFGLAFPIFLWKDFYLKERPLQIFKYLICYGIIAVSLMLVWQYRNCKTLHQFTGLHPIYQNEIPGSYRKTHLAVWEFFKGWESNGANFHGTIGPLLNAALKGDTSVLFVSTLVSRIPRDVRDHFGEKKLTSAFKLYQQSVLAERPYVEDKKMMPSVPLPVEDRVINEFNRLTVEYQKHFWLDYYILTPLRVFKNMAFHSNLSLYIFQHTYRGFIAMETLRWICFLIHSVAFLLIFFFVFTQANVQHKMLFGLTVYMYIFYLIYFQRGIEERYTLPILPVVLINAAYVIKSIFFNRRLVA